MRSSLWLILVLHLRGSRCDFPNFTTEAHLKRILLLATAFVATSGIGMADIMGTVWTGTPDSSNADDPANMGSTLPSAQFTTTTINFDSNSTGYTVGQFLNSPAFTNPQNGFDPTVGADNIEIQLVGTFFLAAGANTFTVEHDDGLSLTINSGASTIDASTGDVNVFSDTGPSMAVLTHFMVDAGAPGNYTFTVDYAECCGAPAVLELSLLAGRSASAPEPGSVVLLTTAGALLSVAMLLRRRQRTARS